MKTRKRKRRKTRLKLPRPNSYFHGCDDVAYEIIGCFLGNQVSPNWLSDVSAFHRSMARLDIKYCKILGQSGVFGVRHMISEGSTS